jgi:hypothetical protein
MRRAPFGGPHWTASLRVTARHAADLTSHPHDVERRRARPLILFELIQAAIRYASHRSSIIVPVGSLTSHKTPTHEFLVDLRGLLAIGGVTKQKPIRHRKWDVRTTPSVCLLDFLHHFRYPKPNNTFRSSLSTRQAPAAANPNGCQNDASHISPGNK